MLNAYGCAECCKECWLRFQALCTSHLKTPPHPGYGRDIHSVWVKFPPPIGWRSESECSLWETQTGEYEVIIPAFPPWSGWGGGGDGFKWALRQSNYSNKDITLEMSANILYSIQHIHINLSLIPHYTLIPWYPNEDLQWTELQK